MAAMRWPGGPTARRWRPPAATANGSFGTPPTGKILAEHDAGAMWAEHLAWSAKPIGDRGHLLALGAGNKVTLWNEKGEAVGEPMKVAKTIAEIAWIMGGDTLAIATSNEVIVRDALDNTDERVFKSRDPDPEHGLQPLRQMADDRQPGLLRPRLEYRQRRGDAHARISRPRCASSRGIAAAAGWPRAAA